MSNEEPAAVLIAGGGIVGLVLAMTIKRQLGITPEVYEKAHAFADDVGVSQLSREYHFLEKNSR